jgi:hypothetical protein
MRVLGARKQRLIIRRVVVGLMIAASTICLGLAGFSGRPDTARVFLFCLAGLLAAGVVLVPPVQKKTTALHCTPHLAAWPVAISVELVELVQRSVLAIPLIGAP